MAHFKVDINNTWNPMINFYDHIIYSEQFLVPIASIQNVVIEIVKSIF